MADNKLVEWINEIEDANKRNDQARVLELKGWINARLNMSNEEKKAMDE